MPSDAQPEPAERTDAPLPALSLRRNFSWALLGIAIYAGCQWAMLIVLARVGTPRMVGQFALAFAITAPVILFADFNLRTVQVTDARREYRFGDYLGLRVATLALAVVAIAAIILGFRYPAETGWVIGMVTVAKLCDSLSDVIYGRLQQRERMDRIALSRMLLGVLQLATLGGVVCVTGSIVWGTAAMATASVLVTTGYDVPNAVRFLGIGRFSAGLRGLPRVLRRCWASGAPWRLACLSLPLGVMRVLDCLNTNVPRYFVEHARGEAALGYYSALASLLMAGGVVIQALGDAASARLARYFIDDLRAFQRLTLALLGIGAAIGLAGVGVAQCYGEVGLSLLYGADYGRHARSLVWIMVGACLWNLASFTWFGLTAARRFRSQAPLLAATIATTTLGSYWLVPRYGLDGAAWAFCAGMAVRLLGNSAILSRVVLAEAAARRRAEGNELLPTRPVSPAAAPPGVRPDQLQEARP